FSRYLRRRLHSNAPAGIFVYQQNDREVSLVYHAKRRTRATLLVAIAVVATSFYVCGFFTATRAGLFSRMVHFATAMFPPDLDILYLRSLALPLLQTIGISVMGTLIGIVIGALLALPATSTIVFAREDEPGRQTFLSGLGRASVCYIARLFLNL